MKTVKLTDTTLVGLHLQMWEYTNDGWEIKTYPFKSGLSTWKCSVTKKI